MLWEILIGSAVISFTILIQAFFLKIIIVGLTRAGQWLVRPPCLEWKGTLALTCSVLWLVAGIGVGACVWAWVFLMTGAFETVDAALYFSLVTFTTLGYGDIVPDAHWRLLSGMTAANGLIIFGLNTGILVEIISQIKNAQNTNGAGGS